MAQDGPGLALGIIFADPGTQHGRADAGTDAANHMDRSGTGEIVEAQLGQPAPAPDPMAGNRIQKQGDTGRIDTVGRELGPLRHGSGDDGRRGGTKHGLENDICPLGYSCGKDVTVVPKDQGVQPANDGAAGTEHQAEAYQPEARRTDAEVHQVFHQNVAGIFRSRKACLTHGKASLHKIHQGCPQQDPNCVYG